MAHENLAEMFFSQAERLGPRDRYLAKRDGRWQNVSWRACAERVRHLASGLLAIGVQPGDTVALLCSTRAEWVEIDLAILSVGAVTIPIYPSSLPAECGYILWNSEAAVVFVENQAQLAKIEQVTREAFELDGEPYRIKLRQVIVVDGNAGAGGLSLDQLAARGRAALDSHKAELERRIGGSKRDELATIVYTSGTTGPPKGVVQTHGNHLASVESVARSLTAEPGEIDFAFLPLAHSFQRMSEYYSIYLGLTTAFAQSIDTLLTDIADTRPHFIPSVPRIFEKIYGRIQSTRAAASPVKRALMDFSFSVGRRASELRQQGQPMPALLQMQYKVADRLVFAKLNQLLGGRVKYMISGGAPLAREIAEFFDAAGIRILEGYGLTETTPVLTVNRPDRYRLGTVGIPLECVSIRIADDGEILAKGPNVASGYHRRPDATSEAWDEEGWFHTGDIGEFDADGFLRITDRKKDLIKTSGGKYVAPQKIENMLKTQPHVSQAVVIGDQKKYCVALLTLDADEMKSWARQRGTSLPPLEQWPADPDINALMRSEVDAVNRQLASFEQVKYFRILPIEFSTDSGELTPSLKVKRKVINERFSDRIEDMYAAH
jgi:long-chain acyl-CoA synthetase